MNLPQKCVGTNFALPVRQFSYPIDNMTNLENEVQTQLCSFGSRLRELRIQRGWTLQDLAHQSGLSKTFLSRLESGSRQASIAAVLTLSRVFDVSLSFLFESQLVTEPCVIVRQADAEEKSANGLFYIPLSNAGRYFNLQPMRVRVPVSRRGKDHYRHDGEEWLYVLSGALTLSLAGKTYDLDCGDAAHFDSRLPHRLIARGSRNAEVLLVASPISGPVMQPIARQYRAIPAPGVPTLKPALNLALTPGRSKSRNVPPPLRT